MSCGSSRRLLFAEQLRVPRIFGVELESRSPFSEARHRRIEHAGTWRDLVLGTERGESVAIDRLHASLVVPVEHQTARHETRAESRLERLEGAIKTVDRASRCAGGRLVHRYRQESLISPVPRRGERRAVRVPLREKTIYSAEQQIRRAIVENTIGAEHPDA